MEYLWVFMSGIILGVIIVVVINLIRSRETKRIAEELVNQAEHQKMQDLEAIIGRMKESFGALSLDALSKNTEEFLKLANERLSKQTESGEKDLDGKKKLIDQTLEAMKTDLKGIQDLVVTLEKDREKKFGELSSQLKSASEQTIKLQETDIN